MDTIARMHQYDLKEITIYAPMIYTALWNGIEPTEYDLSKGQPHSRQNAKLCHQSSELGLQTSYP